MNAYEMYEIGDTFKNDNGENYIVLGLSEDRDKALLCTMKKPTFYIGAKNLYEHHWGFGHYFMEDLEKALNWFAKNDNEPDEEDKEKVMYLFTYETMPRDKSGIIPMSCQMYIMAYNFIEAREVLFNMYTDSDDMVTDYQYEVVPFYDVTKKED